MKIYVASSWRNTQQPAVVAALRGAGHEVYDFRNPAPGDHGFHWSEVDGGYKTWTPAAYRTALHHAVSEHGFRADFEAMKWADACVLLLPCGRSAHLEAGWFAGAGKPLFILLDEKPEPELMYKMSTYICLTVHEVLCALSVEGLPI